jgi:N-acylneuraminate cytidylyltransferase
MELLGIIPARGGSVGIPRKNLAPLAGKPLIVWTIEAARKSRRLTRVVVSTEDEEIAQVAVEAGAEVIRRPAELAGDTTPTEPVLLNVLDQLEQSEGYVPEAVALLQPTSPLRGAALIDRALELWAESGCDAVVSMTPVQNPHLLGTVDAEGRLQPRYEFGRRQFSQEVTPLYSENGAIYVTRTRLLRELENRLGGEVRVLVMDWSQSVDTDSPADLALAEQLIRALGKPE